MKAKLVPADDDLKTDDLTNAGTEVMNEPLLNTEQIAVRFTDFGGKIETYKKYASDLKIEGEDTLMVAENTSSEIMEVFNNVEKVRKNFKEPYYKAGKEIDEHAKKILDPLEKTRKDINAKIANYKTVQAALAAEKAKTEQAELRKIEEAKLEEINRIARIEQQLNARIFGGYWINKSEIRQTSAGCINEQQCDDLLTLIDEKVPKADSYTYYGEKHDEMLTAVRKRIASHKVNVHNANADSKEIRERAQEKIQAARASAEVKTLESKEKSEVMVAKEVKKDEKAIINTVKEIRKGLKKILKFEVIEVDKVGKEYLKVDEDKIKYWMTQHSDEIKQNLQDNKESLPGIRFFIDENYASQ
jgi:hypothetical protein